MVVVTVAPDYYRAMAEAKGCLALRENEDSPVLTLRQLLVLADTLHAGTLNDTQKETAQALRVAILALTGQGAALTAEGVI